MAAKYRVPVRVFGLIFCLVVDPHDTFATESPVIYRCETNGVPTFSDHPCGETAEVHESSAFAMNTYAAPPTASKTTPRVRTRTRPRMPARPAVEPKTAAVACERLERSLDEIRSKMRSGYSAAQGERLKERQAKLRAERRRTRCR